MSEPRKLNTGVARHAPSTPQQGASAAGTAAGAGRSVRTTQAHTEGEYAPAAPVAQVAPAADEAAPYAGGQAYAQPSYSTPPGTYSGSRLRAVDPAEDPYTAARRRAQAQANAATRERRSQQLPRVQGQKKTNSQQLPRQMSAAQRQAAALRQAAQNSGSFRAVRTQDAASPRDVLRAAAPAAPQQAQPSPQPAQPAPRPVQQPRPAAPTAPAPQAYDAYDRPAPQAAPRQIRRQPAAPAPARQPASVQQPAAAPRTVHRSNGGAKVHRAGQPASTVPAPAAPAPVPEEPVAAAPKPPAKHHDAPPPQDPPKGGKSGKGGGKGGKPPKPPKKGGGKKGGSGKGGKKKLKWWQVLLITLGVIVLILGAAALLILHALRPSGGSLFGALQNTFNTPQEFQGDEFNFLMIGIDRTEPDPNNPDDQNVGDGNTDMILWVHFNKNDNSMRMLQIPRDYMCTTDYSVSHNYRINNIAKTQGSGKDDANQWNMHALCEQVATMFQIPVDGYVSIHIEDLIEMVDVFGGVSMYIPQDIEYKGSYLPAGYQTLNGAAAEFLLRNRHGAGYENSDIDRLNMQRRFYAALFRRLKEMTMFDLFRHVPAFLNWMETDLSVSDLASFAVSVLKMPSDNIMICQMPVGTGGVMFNDQSVVYPARQQDADLLNLYFRENTGPVDASELQLVDQELEQNYGIYPSKLTPTDPNVQFMGDMMRADQEAQQNNNLDGSGVEYFEEDPPPAETGTDTGDTAATDGGDAAADPAA